MKPVEGIVQRLTELGALPVARSISEAHGCRLERALSRDRAHLPVSTRRHLWMVLRHTLLLDYSEIARVFDVDHTTVLMGVRQAERELEERVAS